MTQQADAAGTDGTTEEPVENQGSETGDGEADAPVRTRAIVYVPHLGHTPGRSFNDFATRLALVLNLSDPAASVRYSVKDEGETVRFGAATTKTVAPGVTIVREDGAAASAIGVYEYAYSDSFSRRFKAQRASAKVANLLLTVFVNLARLARSFTKGWRPDGARWLVWGVPLNLALLVITAAYLIFDPEEWWASNAVGATAAISAAFALMAAARLSSLGAGDEAGANGSPEDEALPEDPEGSEGPEGSGAQSRRIRGAVSFGAAAVIVGAMLAADPWRTWRADVIGEVLLIAGLLWLFGAWLTLSSSDVGHRIQLGIGFAALGLMSLDAVLVAAAALAQGATLLTEGETVDALAGYLAGVAVVLTTVGISVTPKEVSGHVNNAAGELVAAVRYLSEGYGRDAQTGRLYSLVCQLAESGYTAVDIVGYSFGSILALDTLYRIAPAQVPQGPADVIDRLVTIGSPVVTIGTFWPGYWEGRSPWGGDWINVWSPLDVLSSNLTGAPTVQNDGHCNAPCGEDGEILLPTERVYATTTEKLSAWQKLALRGLRAHSEYWATPFDEDPGAIDRIGDLWAGTDWNGASEDPAGAPPDSGDPVPATT